MLSRSYMLNGTENHVGLFRIDYIISFKNAIADVLCMVTIVSDGDVTDNLYGLCLSTVYLFAYKQHWNT